jgi:anti-anti-sigma regulatory factor
MESPPPTDKIIVAIGEGVCVARVEGRGTFKISGLLRDFGYRVAETGRGALILDLDGCVSMDSTFMGTIANLSFKYKQTQAPRIHLVNLSEKNSQLACTLGLQHLVCVHRKGSEPPAPYREFLHRACAEERLTGPAETPRRQAEIALEAHERLASLSEANRAEFKDVIDFLREDLAARGGTPDSNGL